MGMNLQDFFETIADDPRITVTHVSLYLVLLSEWQPERPEFLELNRGQLMIKAKINARSTYDKVMQDFHAFGYFVYERGRGNRKGRVKLKRL